MKITTNWLEDINDVTLITIDNDQFEFVKSNGEKGQISMVDVLQITN